MSQTGTLVPTSHTAQQVGGIKRSKKYAALVEVGLDEISALGALGVTFSEVGAPAKTEAEERIDALVNSGAFSRKEATRIVEAQFFTAAPTVAPTVKAAPKAEPLTDKVKADALVTQAGLAHGKGRTYSNGEIIEAQARVLKGGAPEIIATSGVSKRVSHVLIFREESGDVAVQNLYDPTR